MSEWTDDFGNVVINVHTGGMCVGQFCTIHNPSDHPLSLAPQKWSDIYGVMLRVCVHGKNHIDIDEPPRTNSSYRAAWSKFCEYCDGCCRFKETD
mgnify:CR=1 FL=1